MTRKISEKYYVSSDEDFEPNSKQQVLKNHLGIKLKSDMEALEEKELLRAELEVLDIFDENHQFSAEDICNIHELWLGDIYPFAGKYRTVNMAKDGFLFAAVNRIETLMLKLESDILAKYTPCNYSNLDKMAEALGIVHVELILIHPFRDGNGRVARVLADLMAVQANKSPLNYGSIDQSENRKGFEKYILAIQAGLAGDYNPIEKVFKMLFEQSF